METSIIPSIVFGVLTFVLGVLATPHVMPIILRAYHFVFGHGPPAPETAVPLVGIHVLDPLRASLSSIVDELRSISSDVHEMRDLSMTDSRSSVEWVGEMRLRRSRMSAQNTAPQPQGLQGHLNQSGDL
ncbi:hypothetical protein E8E14_000873 [Neopestalotiopsis sp. 37M]|nr:hypothetical protein E8E14_000873 [Neopestalotiopsis sp. 37M]